ncbi:MAG: sugar ABC transporter permease [Chloroflexota bacterium]|nr:sugar ABC transporter permease [Chloroflexota bacterium]
MAVEASPARVAPRRGTAVLVGLSGRQAREIGVALLYLTPSLLLFAAFTFIPLVRSVWLSLYHTNPIGNPTTFAGLEHYLELFRSATFWNGMRATFLYVLYTVPPGIVLALLLAALVNQKLKGINAFRTMMASTIAVSAAVGSLIWLLLLNPALGLLNYTLGLLRVGGPQWLTDPNWAVVAVALTSIWLTLGFNIIVLLAGMQSIPEELYESGRIDGAVAWRSFWHLTVPLLSPSLFFLGVVNTINVFQAFTQVHLLTRGGPVDATRTIVYSLYLDAFQNFLTGYASAQAMVLFALILVLTILQFRYVERFVHYQ